MSHNSRLLQYNSKFKFEYILHMLCSERIKRKYVKNKVKIRTHIVNLLEILSIYL